MGFSFSFRDFMYDSLITWEILSQSRFISGHTHASRQWQSWPWKGCWTTSPRTLQGCAKWQCAFFGASKGSHRGFAVLCLWRKRVGSDHYCLYDDVVSLGRKEAQWSQTERQGQTSSSSSRWRCKERMRDDVNITDFSIQNMVGANS